MHTSRKPPGEFVKSLDRATNSSVTKNRWMVRLVAVAIVMIACTDSSEPSDTTLAEVTTTSSLAPTITLLLRSLWTVARSRYTDDDSPVETFQMQKPITEVFGDSTPSESSIRTVRSILQTINEEKAGEERVWELEIDEIDIDR